MMINTTQTKKYYLDVLDDKPFFLIQKVYQMIVKACEEFLDTSKITAIIGFDKNKTQFYSISCPISHYSGFNRYIFV